MGCPQIPIPYEQQLAAKRHQLAAALAPLGIEAERVHATVPSPLIRGYRNQARLVFRKMSRGGHTHIGLGLYLPGTHRVVHIPNCPIQPERLNAIAASVTQIAEDLDFSVYDERAATGVLRYLALRCDRARKHVLMTIIAGEDNGEPLRALARAVHRRHPEIAGASLHINARHSNVLFAGEDAWTFGAERLEDQIGRFRVLVSPRSFLQVNHAQAEWIYARLEERLGGGAEARPHEVVLDLYCGVGAIALHLARPGRRVIGVEESEEAVEDARRAAHLNGVAGVQFVAARVEDFLRDPARFGVDLGGQPLRTAVLNPPRAGCRAGVMEALAALSPDDLAYVSCRPFSLVRDLELLRGRYRVTEATPVDMIPLTPHVESLVFLRRV
jgi:23S rRNA (uracil1939-C5)-methyltransferase